MQSSKTQTFSDRASLMSCHMTKEKVTRSDNEHLTSQSLRTKLPRAPTFFLCANTVVEKAMALLKQINIINSALTAARVQGTCLLRICDKSG